MKQDCGVSTVVATILLVAVTVLLAAVLVVAVTSLTVPLSAEQLPVSLTVSEGIGYFVFPLDAGIEQIRVVSPSGEFVYPGVSPVLITEEYLDTPATFTGMFGNGDEEVLLRI